MHAAAAMPFSRFTRPRMHHRLIESSHSSGYFELDDTGGSMSPRADSALPSEQKYR
jgi:hypothetical protein